MNSRFVEEIRRLNAGDLVRVDWCDASIGKSLTSGKDVDVPVQSWGIFIGVLGEKKRHFVIAQNSYRFSDGMYDLDYTAIPVGWSFSVTPLVKNHLQAEEAKDLLTSFLNGGRQNPARRKIQQRVRNH